MRFKLGLGVGAMLLAVFFLPTGCDLPGVVVGAGDQTGDSADADADAGVDALPDFSAPDVNAASARFQQDVSPSDYLQQVSAWYFGHST